MADLNATLVEESTQLDEKVKEGPEDVVENQAPDKNERFPCDKCGRIYVKVLARNLHMDKVHNIKTIKYTPLPAKRKVGRPQTRFHICDVCNVKMITESELNSHMKTKHANKMKRSHSEKKHEPVERTMSVTKSPPKKKTNVDITSSRDDQIEVLQEKNKNLNEAVEKKQEQLSKQANIIGSLRGEIHSLKIDSEAKSEEIEKQKKLYYDIIEESKKKDTTENIEIKENVELKRRLESQNLTLFDWQQRGQNLFDENVRLTEEVKHTERYWNTILAKDEEIKELQKEVQKLKAEDKTEANSEDENVNELVILAASKSAGHERDTPQSQPIQKKTQFHCALSNKSSGILCSFECNTKEELDKHISEGHTSFPCSDRDCTVNCDTLDNLAKHVSMVHGKNHVNTTADFKCNICGMESQTKSELIDHIKIHKSYKPCQNYAMNKCERESEECRYKHIILPPGVHVCYKCGVTSSSKTDIIKHIKAKHGNEICHNFLLKRCEFQNCMFSHSSTNAQCVEIISEREMETPSAPTESDFFNPSTIGPVVRAEERAQPQTPQGEGLSSQQQEMIRQVTVRQITMHIEKMLPQILANITEAMTKKTIPPK